MLLTSCIGHCGARRQRRMQTKRGQAALDRRHARRHPSTTLFHQQALDVATLAF